MIIDASLAWLDTSQDTGCDTNVRRTLCTAVAVVYQQKALNYDGRTDYVLRPKKKKI